MMNSLLINLLLAVAWMLLVGKIDAGTFLEGVIVSYLILWVASPVLGGRRYFRKIPLAIRFIFYFIKELLLANLKVAWDILTPRHHMRPGIVAVPLEARSDIEITLFANLLTLTPGTLSLDVSSDKKVIYVHALYVDDDGSFRREIKEGLEKRLLEVLR